ncbi:hypothetical protein HAX54_036154 [Datura stramonium]|uniref:Uncharacterized protein n=1 Tax=Datura stramonium TaxID=4076 RepID=A0ABS8SG12_DATST|nr:hypothetical protein [Datura stramonium]
MGILCFIQGKATAPQAQGPHKYITIPTIGLGAGARGAYNSRGNQFALLGRENPITLDIPQEAVVPTVTPSDLLKIAQKAQVHEIQLVKLAKTIPSMIQTAIKKAMQPAKDKLKSLCSTFEFLESEVISLRREVAAINEPPSTSNSNPPEPATMPVQLEEPRSPPEDWWVGYDSMSGIVSDKELYHSRPPPPLMLSVYDVNPPWPPGGVITTSYHELRTLPTPTVSTATNC